jgi:uncharacterized membrane protein YeaQ/YmgE (transglycosylase-associated protein family)
MGFLIALVVGGLAGWLASMVAGRDSSLGLLGNIVVGFLGAVIVNFFFGANTSLSNPTLGSFLLDVLGAIILLVVVNLFTRRRPL